MKAIKGLSLEEVNIRKKNKQSNGDFNIKSKSYLDIIIENVFTPFNILNCSLGLCLFLVHSYKNMLFLGVVVWNTLIGIIQQIKSKRIADNLSVMANPKTSVIRDGNKSIISVGDIVIDDLLLLEPGSQICADCEIVSGEIEVNESLITGESLPVRRVFGDKLYSGSFIVSGNAYAKVTAVGKNSYVNKIAVCAKKIKGSKSEILKSVNKIIKYITFLIIPLMIFMFYSQIIIDENNFNKAVVRAVGGVIGMIPSGLVLLTSLALAAGVIRLGKKNALVQDLYCIETLARTDVLCLDKTGTITEGVMETDGIEVFVEYDKTDIESILGNTVNCFKSVNPTICAVKERYGKTDTDFFAENIIEFSSERKWCLVRFKDKGTYILGANEFILKNGYSNVKNKIKKYEEDGFRILLLAHSESIVENDLPNNITPICAVKLRDKIRKEAFDAVKYFIKEGVSLKVISGDSPVTAASAAKKAGILNSDMFIDVSKLETEKQISDAALKYTVFGRVTPKQKQCIIKALRENGHTVAMTGDGVNDVLAFKEADCSIAMQSGTDAARAAANIVLINSDFSSLSHIVAQGRRIINNIQRSSILYLTKTVYSIILALFFIFSFIDYPLEPIHLTLAGAVTIGMPSFIMAFEPNEKKVEKGFLANILTKALFGGVSVSVWIIGAQVFGMLIGFSEKQISSLSVYALWAMSWIILLYVSVPLNKLRRGICIISGAIILCSAVFFRGFFGLSPVWTSVFRYLLSLLC